MKLKIIIMISLALTGYIAAAQNIPKKYNLVVGKTCPDFPIRNIEFAPVKQATINAYRNLYQGKWLIIDFWNKGCSSCVKLFPEENEWQKKYKKNIQFLLIGEEDNKNEIRPLYEKYRTRLHLDLTCAFDSLLFRNLDITSCPHYLVISPDGILKAVTNHIESADLDKFLKGEMPSLSNTYIRSSRSEGKIYILDEKKPYLSNGNGGPDSLALLRITISKVDEAKYASPRDTARSASFKQNVLGWAPKLGQFIIIRWTLADIYRQAYFGNVGAFQPQFPFRGDVGDNIYGNFYGKYAFNISYECSDSSRFISKDRQNIVGRYGMSVMLPQGATVEDYQRAIIGALDNYLNVKSSIETKMVPCWKLIVSSDKAKSDLMTKGDKPFITGNRMGKNFINVTVDDVIYQLYGLSPFFREVNWQAFEDPIFDETGIKGNIDINIDAPMTDSGEVLKSLRAKGLELVRGYKEMKVLVIKDAAKPGPLPTVMKVE